MVQPVQSWSEIIRNSVLIAVLILISLLATSCAVTTTTVVQNLQSIDDPRRIDAAESLWIEELTWQEIRDSISAGTTTIIIGTGGIEQNGPYVAGGKHNYVLQTVLPYIATEIGDALIAPIVKFVPEGEIEP